MVSSQDAESESLLSGVAVGTMLLLNPAPAAVTEESRHIQMVETEVQTVKREIEGMTWGLLLRRI